MTTEEYNFCVNTMSDGLLRFIVKNLKDLDEAENIVQNTFEKLWLRKESIDTKTVKPYIYKVAYNNMIDIIRKRKNHSDIADYQHLPAKSNHEYNNLTEIINQYVELLPANQKSVLLLRDYESHDYKTIEQITGQTEGQVKINLFRARKFLKEKILKLNAMVL